VQGGLACSSSDDDSLESDAATSDPAPNDADQLPQEDGASADTGQGAGATACRKDLLEPDFGSNMPLTGPGVDPSTGTLLPRDEPFIVATTYLALKSEPDAQEKFMQVLGPINEDLASRDGLIAVGLGGSNECGTARTLTVWRDEAAMNDFVFSAAHVVAIGAVALVSRGGSVTMSWAESDVGRVSWDQAAARLANHQGKVY
jgi:heme-degrading monooxygenase HmoA